VNSISAQLPQDREPLELTAQDGRLHGWASAMSLGSTFLMLAAVAYALRSIDPTHLLAMVPARPAFWLTFAASYLCVPAAEWVIYRRLWKLPAGCIAPLLRKLVCNELLLGYLGEAYLYGWARRHVDPASAPFGAIKDVAILSAIAGNGVALAMLALVWPFVEASQLGLDSRTVTWSLALVLASSIAIMLLRRRVFTLDRSDLLFIFGMHLVRIFASMGLTALLWHLVLPGVHLQWWLFLATLRMLISRLPLIPNKDVVFAGVAVFTLGHEAQIAELMAMLASLVVLTHVAVGVGLVVRDLLVREQRG